MSSDHRNGSTRTRFPPATTTEHCLSAFPHSPPVIGIDDPPAALLTPLLEALAQRQLRCGVIQCTDANYDPDIPGKDSYELRKAGVERLLLAAEQKSALIHEHPDDPPDLARCLALLALEELDLVLVTDSPPDWLPAHCRIRAYSHGVTGAPRCLAYLADRTLDAPVPVLSPDDPGRLAAFLHDTVINPVAGDDSP